MEDDQGVVEDDRIIELSSIAAIYPELVVDQNDPYTATLDLAVTPIEPLRIAFQSSTDGAPPSLPTPPASSDDGRTNNNKAPLQQSLPLDSHQLSHLPPLSLRITLPDGYPATQAPIISISIKPQWLGPSVMKKLKEDCARLWEEMGKDQVVYSYIDHVQQEAEQAFGLAGETDVSMPSDIKLALLDYDLTTKREKFEKETFDCGVCLEPKKGLICHRLIQCGHVFCRQCLQDYYNNCLTEGDVDNVKCLDPGCGKDEAARVGPNGRPLKKRKRDKTLNPTELLQIPISHELVQRYVQLKRKNRLEADKNTVYCPRQWCQGAARSKKHPKPTDLLASYEDSSEEEEEPEPEDTPGKKKKKKSPESEDTPMGDRLCICEDCAFAFCAVCKKSWHGEMSRCSPRRQKELNEEEAASAEYMKRFSTPCPTCNAPAQKAHGCNHMTCFKCKSHFCYLCSSYLIPDNPYRHYNDPASPCHMRLWVLEEGDGMDVDRQAFHNPEFAHWDEEAEDDEDEDEPELPPENNEAFRGDPVRPFADEEDSEDEEPAPDQRRNRNIIEIVNFAGPGGQNARRIELPDQPRAEAVVPPAAPNPPRGQQRRGNGQQANRQRALANEPARANPRQVARLPRRPAARVPQDIRVIDAANGEIPAAQPAGNHDEEPEEPRGELPPAAPGQGNQQAGPVRGMGLERFLEMAARDEEDEWDSDELEGDDFGDDGQEFDFEPRRGERARVLGGYRVHAR